MACWFHYVIIQHRMLVNFYQLVLQLKKKQNARSFDFLLFVIIEFVFFSFYFSSIPSMFSMLYNLFRFAFIIIHLHLLIALPVKYTKSA